MKMLMFDEIQKNNNIVRLANRLIRACHIKIQN